MEVTISETKLDDSKTRGVKCLLCDARSNPAHDVQAEMNFKKALQNVNPQMGLSVMAKDDCTDNSCVETKFGESQSGSFCSYQLTHTEANFVATVDISSIPREDMDETELTYPRFRLNSGSDFVRPDNLSHSEETVVSSLLVDENMTNKIEEATRGQTLSEQWKKE